jgi:glyoxylase-like metal-dependent hydrolase (beta-lactamase superfamily II)
MLVTVALRNQSNCDHMRLFSIAMICIVSLQAAAQPSNLLESNRKGLEILRKSQKAYGGAAASDSMKLAFKMNAEKSIVRGQSLNPYAPYEPYFSYFDFIIDRPKGLEYEARKSSIAGFVFESTSFYKSGKGFGYDPTLKDYYDVTGSSIASSMTYLPANVIATALRSPMSVRYVNDQLLGSDSVHLIIYSIGSLIDNIYIDKKTYYALRLQRIYNTGSGEEVVEFFYRNHGKAGNIVIPAETEVITHNNVYGKTSTTYVFSDLKTDFSVDTALFKVPEGYKLRDYSYRKKFEARPLAKDIYLLENITSSTGQWSYNVLFVVMDEYVLVAEAPLNSGMTERVIAKIKEVAPGKPVRYLVQSHHHDDHMGGIRGYIAEGATIITTANNTGIIRDIANLRYNASPDKLAREPKPVKFETVQNKKHVIKDRNHEIVIYDVGPNAHANEMLIVYFPNEKLIYEADLINKGEYPLTGIAQDFIKKIKALGLKVEKIASLHGQVVEKEDVEKLLSTGGW